MVFPAGVLHGHSSIHSRHTFSNLPCLLHCRRTRLPFSAHASSEQSPVLASKPSLAGPPKRPPAPSETAQEQQPKATDSSSLDTQALSNRINGLNGNAGKPGTNGGARPSANNGNKQAQHQKAQQHKAQQQNNRKNKQKTTPNESNRPAQHRTDKKGHPKGNNEHKGKDEANLRHSAQADLSSKTNRQGNTAPQKPAPAAPQSSQASSQQQPAASQPAPVSTQPPAPPAVQKPKINLPTMAGPPTRRPVPKPAQPLDQHLPRLARDHKPLSYDQPPHTFSPASQSFDQPVSAASTSVTVDMPPRDAQAEPTTTSTVSNERPAESDSTAAAPATPPQATPPQATPPQATTPQATAQADTAQQLIQPDAASASNLAPSLPEQSAQQAPADPPPPAAPTPSAPLGPAPAPSGPAPAPSAPAPAMAGPPKRPPSRPTQQMFNRSELPGGWYGRSRDTSRDLAWDNEPARSELSGGMKVQGESWGLGSKGGKGGGKGCGLKVGARIAMYECCIASGKPSGHAKPSRQKAIDHSLLLHVHAPGTLCLKDTNQAAVFT